MASTASLTILSTHTVDLSPSLLLIAQNKRYLFNIPESLSRVAVQSKIQLRRVGNIFIGNLGEGVAGLPGGILSIVEAGGREIQVNGSEGLEHAVASFRFFTRREQLSLLVNEITPNTPTTDSLPPPIFEDEILSVYAFPLNAPLLTLNIETQSPPPVNNKRRRSSSPERSPKLAQPSSTATSSTTEALYDAQSFSFDPSTLPPAQASHWRKAVISDMFRSGVSLPRTMNGAQTPSYLLASLPPFQKKQEECISYLGIAKRTRGEFLTKVAVEKGVTPGPKFAQLVKGERVWVTKKVFIPPPVEEVVGPEPIVNIKGKSKVKPLTEDQKRGAIRSAKRVLINAERAWEASIIDGEGQGYWVEPSECLGPGKEGEAFLVLNISSVAFLDSLLTILPTSLLELESINLKTIYYFLGSGVLNDSRLLSWISSFSNTSTISHHFSSSDLIKINNPVVFAPATLLNLRLQQLDPMFHLPHYCFLPNSQADDLKYLPTGFPPNSRISRANESVGFGSTTTSLGTAPRPKKEKVKIKIPIGPVITGTPAPPRDFNFHVPSPSADAAAMQLKSLEKEAKVHEAATKIYQDYLASSLVAKVSVLAEESSVTPEMKETRSEVGDDLIVTPLGTGSAIPSKYRNVSSTLLHLPDGQYILLDAGEGTWGQLIRRFGVEGVKEVLKGLKLIFISHMHQDHHAGLVTILKHRNLMQAETKEKLVIIAPQGVPIYLKEQSDLIDLGIDQIQFIPNYNIESKKTLYGSYEAIMDTLKTQLGMTSITTVPVLHRCRCWGIVLVHSTGYKVAFSGDTMPCDALVEAGSNATLLIHEATIESEKPEVAAEKGHSTFAQAIDIATRMKAKHCLLTHFSARYPKLPPVHSNSLNQLDIHMEGEEIALPIIAIAFDLMSIRLDEFWKIDRYRDAMEVLFSEVETEKESIAGDEIET